MKAEKITEAEIVALRFLKVLKLFRQRAKDDDMFSKYQHIVGFRETAALRRASMDLTRALADMRKQ